MPQPVERYRQVPFRANRELAPGIEHSSEGGTTFSVPVMKESVEPTFSDLIRDVLAGFLDLVSSKFIR
jgi:hypothetical protein